MRFYYEYKDKEQQSTEKPMEKKSLYMKKILGILTTSILLALTPIMGNATEVNAPLIADDSAEYFKSLEEVYSKLDLNKYTVDYIHKNLNIKALIKKHPFISYEEYQTFGTESDKIIVGTYLNGGGIFEGKIAGIVDKDFNIKREYNKEALKLTTTSTRDEVKVTDTNYTSVDDYNLALYSEFPLQENVPTTEVIMDTSFQDDAIIIHTHDYFLGMYDQNTYVDTYYYISVWNEDLLAVNKVNVIDGTEYEGCLTTNFRYEQPA